MAAIADILRRLVRLARWQVAVGGVAAVGAAATAVAAVSACMPAPELYVESTIRAPLQRDAPKVPMSHVKFRNSGGGPMTITNLRLLSGARQVASFADVINCGNPAFTLLMESNWKAYKGCTIAEHSPLFFATVRPTDAYEDTPAWEEQLRKQLAEKEVKMEVAYTYMDIPFWGPLFSAIKTCKLQ